MLKTLVIIIILFNTYYFQYMVSSIQDINLIQTSYEQSDYLFKYTPCCNCTCIWTSLLSQLWPQITLENMQTHSAERFHQTCFSKAPWRKNKEVIPNQMFLLTGKKYTTCIFFLEKKKRDVFHYQQHVLSLYCRYWYRLKERSASSDQAQSPPTEIYSTSEEKELQWMGINQNFLKQTK